MQADFAALDLHRSYSARSFDDSLRGEDAASSIGAGWIPAQQAGTSAPSAKTCAGPVTAFHEGSRNQAVDVGAPDMIFSTGVAVGDEVLSGTFGTFAVDSRGLLMWPRPGCPSAGHRPGKRPDPESDSDSDSDDSVVESSGTFTGSLMGLLKPKKRRAFIRVFCNCSEKVATTVLLLAIITLLLIERHQNLARIDEGVTVRSDDPPFIFS